MKKFYGNELSSEELVDGSQVREEPMDDLPSDSVEISDILDDAEDGTGERWYFVPFKGFTNRHNDWVRAADLNADNLLREYERSRGYIGT
jgi:hypothetical protein